MKAVVLHPSGQVEYTERVDLEDLQRFVGGYIEGLPVPRQPAMTAFVNEEGKLNDLPVNPMATGIMRNSLMPDDWISGSIVFCGIDEAGELQPVPDDFVEVINEAVLAVAGHQPGESPNGI